MAPEWPLVCPPPALGRGLVVATERPLPPPWDHAERVVVDDAALAAPRQVADRLHRLWLARTPVVVVLAADPAALRAAETCAKAPWVLGPGFEFSRERLQFLVWSNNYDWRGDEPIWWHARRAMAVGALAPPPGAACDVVLVDATPVWCDGGPRQFLDLGAAAVVHRESIEEHHLVPARWSAPSAHLAPDQLAAVGHGAGPARIIAPAGSGKTRVLTERLRHLLADRGVEPELVTAVAFNKRAAEEMAERTVGLRPQIRTLNALGLAILNGSGGYLATGRRRRVLEEVEVRRILEGLVELRRAQNTDPLAPYIEGLSAIRLGLVSPTAAEEAFPDATGLAAAFERYRVAMAEAGAVDFDEQVYGAIEVLLTSPEARVVAQRLSRHLLVDEFQDLTPAHLLLLRLVSAPAYDVFGVGDDDQVIYSYAGADPEFLIGFEKYFPSPASYALEVNYRCPPTVVEAARSVLSYNHRRIDKTIRPAPGRPPVAGELALEPVASPDQATVAATTLAAWAGEGRSYAEMAVLARVNSTLLAVQVGLSEAGVPHSAPLGAAILTRTGIRAALAYLRIGLDPERIARADIVETVRRPGRRIARNVVEMATRRPHTSLVELRRLATSLSGGDGSKVAAYAADLSAVAAAVAPGRGRAATTASVLAVIRDQVGLGSAMEMLDSSRSEADRSTHGDDLAALEQVAALHPDPASFAAWLAEVLARPATPGGVTLATVHKVKGREWPLVVVFGANAGSLPHRLATEVEEERRVFHVAITRGVERVVVLADTAAPSPFCAEAAGTAPRRPPPAEPSRTTRARAEATRPAPAPRRRPERAPAPAGPPPLEASVGLALAIPGGMSGTLVEVGPTGAKLCPGGRARLVLSWGSEVVVEGRRHRLVRPGSPTPEAAAEALRVWRRATAARDKVPAYVVLTEEYLEVVATALPTTMAELARCRGMGPVRLERYGAEILAVLDAAAPTSG